MHLFRRLGAALALMAGGAAGGAGQALAQAPRPWQIGMQTPASPVARDILALHSMVLWIITVITLFVAARNRGETSMRIVNADSAGEQIRVPAKTLLGIVQEEKFDHIDAIKLDVEGAEDLILEPFFRNAPEALRPKLVLMEYSHGRWAADLGRILDECGYREVLRTRTNVAYERA